MVNITKKVIGPTTYDIPQGTVTSVATGVGLTGGSITSSGTIKAKLKSETLSTLESSPMGSEEGRQYAVGVDKDGYLSVNVPDVSKSATNSFTDGIDSYFKKSCIHHSTSTSRKWNTVAE